MDRIAVTTSSLFPIDLLSIVFLNELISESNFEVFLNSSYYAGKKENAAKVARGAIPTFNWEHELDGTWRLNHIPLLNILNSEDGHSTIGSSFESLINEGIISSANMDCLLANIANSVSAEEFYSLHLSQIFKANKVENVVFSDFSEIRNGRYPKKLKNDLFKTLLKLAGHNPQMFSRGGSIIDSSTGVKYTHIMKDAEGIKLFHLQEDELTGVAFSANEFCHTPLRLTGNLEMLVCSGEDYTLAHAPWYSHLDTNSTIEVYESITPISCHDDNRAGDSLDSKRLNPTGYTLLDYSGGYSQKLMNALLGDDKNGLSHSFLKVLCQRFPSAKEKISNHQGKALSRFSMGMRKSFEASLEKLDPAIFENKYGIQFESTEIESLFLCIELLDLDVLLRIACQ
jgi:hypothetical protein